MVILINSFCNSSLSYYHIRERIRNNQYNNTTKATIRNNNKEKIERLKRLKFLLFYLLAKNKFVKIKKFDFNIEKLKRIKIIVKLKEPDK